MRTATESVTTAESITGAEWPERDAAEIMSTQTATVSVIIMRPDRDGETDRAAPLRADAEGIMSMRTITASVITLLPCEAAVDADAVAADAAVAVSAADAADKKRNCQYIEEQHR